MRKTGILFASVLTIMFFGSLVSCKNNAETTTVEETMETTVEEAVEATSEAVDTIQTAVEEIETSEQ